MWPQSLRFDPGIMRRYLRLGVPAGVESFLNMATFNLFLLMFQSYGVVAGAAMAIVFNWDMLSFIPLVGLNISVMSLIGRFVGMGDMGRANQVISSGFILALAYCRRTGGCLPGVSHDPGERVSARPGRSSTPSPNSPGSMMIGLCTYMLADAMIRWPGARCGEPATPAG